MPTSSEENGRKDHRAEMTKDRLHRDSMLAGVQCHLRCWAGHLYSSWRCCLENQWMLLNMGSRWQTQDCRGEAYGLQTAPFPKLKFTSQSRHTDHSSSLQCHKMSLSLHVSLPMRLHTETKPSSPKSIVEGEAWATEDPAVRTVVCDSCTHSQEGVRDENW